MEMKMKLTSGLLGIAALLLASQVNAATISVNPSENNVAVGDIFTLTVSGDFSSVEDLAFINGTGGGSVELSWDSNQVVLLSDVGSINTSIGAGFAATVIDITVSSLRVDLLWIDFFSNSPPTFDLFSLDFEALSPPVATGEVVVVNGTVLSDGWEIPDGRVVNFTPATVNVSAVPVPAAVWLFGSGLIGLVGIARRRTPQSA
jgi:hypothetical protein